MKVRVKERKNRKGLITLGIEIYWGYTKDSNGKIKHQREYFPLDLYLYDNPAKNSKEFKHNKKVKTLAENIRKERELKIVKGEYGYTKPEEKKSDYLISIKK